MGRSLPVIKMANREFEESDLESAAKALGCEDCLSQNKSSQRAIPPLRDPSFYDHYVQDALKGSVSFSPNDRNEEKKSYSQSFTRFSRSERSINGWRGNGNSVKNMMSGKPGHDRD